MGKFKIAIPTMGSKGLDDRVSDIFGRAKTFTIIEISDGSIDNIDIIENPAISYEHGVGPIVIKMLTDIGVSAVAFNEMGVGASILLDQNNIRKVKVESGIPVREAVKAILKELEQ
mgnify:FL=1